MINYFRMLHSFSIIGNSSKSPFSYCQFSINIISSEMIISFIHDPNYKIIFK